jgi:hypothetical protein
MYFLTARDHTRQATPGDVNSDIIPPETTSSQRHPTA